MTNHTSMYFAPPSGAHSQAQGWGGLAEALEDEDTGILSQSSSLSRIARVRSAASSKHSNTGSQSATPKLPKALHQRPSTTPSMVRPSTTGGSRLATSSMHSIRPGSGSCGVPPVQPTRANSLVVEGCQTGQVVQGVEPARRRSGAGQADAVPLLNKASTQDRDKERRERLRDKQLIRKLEAEVKRLKALLGGKDEQISELQVKLSDVELQLSQAEEAHRTEAESLRESLQAKASEVGKLQVTVGEGKAEIEKLRRRLSDQEGSSNTRVKEQEVEMARLRDQVEDGRSALDALVLKHEREQTSLRERLSSAEQGGRDSSSKLREEIEALRKRLEKADEETQAARARYKAYEGEVQAAKEQVVKYNDFIVKLCQPQFSVVKDESLTPVDPNGFQVVEGHVLIPLVLLLEGYGFLPTTMRNTKNVSSYQPPTQTRSRPSTAAR